MELFTPAGPPVPYSDLYSVFPYDNSTFPEGETTDVPQTNGTGAEPGRSGGGMVIAISITALYSVICVVGLLGNVLVMYGVVR